MRRRSTWCLLAALAAGCGEPQPSPFNRPPPEDVVNADILDAEVPALDAPADDGPTDDADVADDAPPAMDADAPAPLDVADVLDATDVADAFDATDAAEVEPFDAAAPVCPGPLLSTITLPSPSPVTVSGATAGESRNVGASCQPVAEGPEDYHRLDVTARSVVTLSTEGAATDLDTVLAVRGDCASAVSEVACDDDGGETPATASRIRAVLERGSYALVVDGRSGPGRYRLTARATPAAPNGTCATAMPLTPGTTLRAQAVDGGYDPAFACLPVAGAGQLFYDLTVPAGSAATVTATPLGSPASWTPVLRLFDRCGATTCAASITPSSGAPAALTVNNEGAAARSYRVSVSSSSSAAFGAFDLAATAAAPRPGTACATALALMPDGDVRGSLADATVPSAQCRPSAAGNVLFYRISVPAATRVDVALAPQGSPAWTPVVRVLDACDATSCAFDGQGNVAGAPFTLSFANVGAAERAYIVAVGASAPGPGEFTLRATTAPLADGARCAVPFTLRADTAVTGRNLADGVDAITACRPTAGRVQYYAVDVPARSVATLRVTPSSGWTPAVRVLPSCGASSCLYDSLGAFGAPSTHAFANEGDFDRRVYVTVGASSTASTGTYDLDLSTAPATDGQVCSRPLTLTAGTPRTAQRLEDGRLTPGVCRPTGGPARFYTFTANGLQAYTVRVTPSAMPLAWAPQVRVFEGCGATTCELDASGMTGSALTVTGVNGVPSPRTYVVSVNASSTAVTTGTYDIALTLAEPAVGALCAEPTPLTPGVAVPMQATAAAGASSFACLTESDGPQLFYRIQVPSGLRARVLATPAIGTTATPVLRAIDSCAAASCITAATGTASGAALDVPNFDPAPRDVLVTLGTASRTTSGTYTLTASLAPAMDGQFCERATAIVAGTMVRGNTVDGVTTAFGCLGGSYGGQLFYRVGLPAGRRVTVTARPTTATVALRLRALPSCASTSCLASSTTAAAGAAATLTFANNTLSDRQVFFSVASSTATTNTDFTLAAAEEAITAPASPYTASLITASCDVLTGAATVAPPGGWADDTATAIAPLPFAFRFFGDMAARYAVSSNGNLQLFDASGGTPSGSGANVALPSSSLPNGLVAPFWDDFTADGEGVVRTATLGSAGARRFVVEWRAWRFGGDPGAPLTFQAKLFEATGEVEFHYCLSSTVGSERTTGASATIGLEDRTGTAAALVSLDWPGTARPGNGWRLTPR
ncbi:MAG: hypothetical protein U0324_07145 [Polyangiales bacterium]